MRRFLGRILSVAVLAAASVSVMSAQTTPTRGVIRVKLEATQAAKVTALARQGSARLKARGSQAIETGVVSLDKAARSARAVQIRPMVPPVEKFAAQRAKYGIDQWFVVEFDPKMEPAEACRIFGSAQGVAKVEAVVPMQLVDGNKGFRKVTKADMQRAAAGAMPFNDPMLKNQWHYKNFGNIPYSVAGADINLFDAWASVTGNPDVLVAIIDGGVDYKHEDLAANMHVNLAELNGTPGVDDDGNGYVDDIYGYNFCTGEGKVYPHSHGTHVAGTVAAVNNNGIGVSGVAGGNGSKNSGVRMISCQVFDSRSGTGDGDFAAALVYAAERGATIAQCSWGWASDGYYEQAVLDAIDYFTETARSSRMRGGLCIFAAGNTGETGTFYPAAYPKVVGVNAMTSELQPASYSCRGPWIDIVAPGGLMDYGSAQGVLSTLPNNQYGYNEGTSMATPHVSGIAALILSKYGSPTFLNETLRTQLVSSVNDFYGYGDNAQYAGLFGSGYIDAAKAVNMDQGSVPGAVEDFTLTAAQDYINVSWTVNGDNVSNHIIYYSTKPITEATLALAKQKVVDTKFLANGAAASADLTGLEALTTYYVAVKAVNRWGAASPLSVVKETRTNAGPEITVAESSVTLKANAANPLATGHITIGNNAEGLLKWSAAKRSVPTSMFSGRVTPGNMGSWKGRLGVQRAALAPVAARAEYNADEYPRTLSYYNELWAMIGEDDKTLPNSMAQWFRVDADKHPDGFNLTGIRLEAPEGGLYGTNPRIQIYRGDVAISSATLLQNVEYSYFTYNNSVKLREQIHFAPGESFWVVVHFDAGQEGYPLSMGRTDNTANAANSYMSNDLGKTWVKLATALKGSGFESQASNCVWAMSAVSANPDWSEMLMLNPAQGTVKQGETQKVDLSVDGSKLVNGTYKFNVKIATNETGNRVVTVPATLTVEGNTHNVAVPKVVDFGSLLVGANKTVTVEVYNHGYGAMRGGQWSAGLYSDNITSSSEHFAGPENGIPSGIPARATTRFELTYKPQSAGSHSGVITLTDGDGRQVRILVQGAATEPARLAVEPATVNARDIAMGQEPATVEFTVTNAGKYPLEYVFPKYSDATVDGAGAQHKFGYNISANIEGFDGFEYTECPVFAKTVDVTKQFSDINESTAPVSIGFAFPYYGKSYEQVYITSYGALIFAPNQTSFWSPLSPSSGSIAGTGMIAAYGRQLQFGPDSHVEYGTADGKFTVNYRNVLALVYDKDYVPVSFRITLCPDGSVEVHYDNYESAQLFQEGSGTFCGINDPEVADPLTVTSADWADIYGSKTELSEELRNRFRLINSGTAVRFEAPQASFVTAVEPAYGLVSPGESVTVKATLSVGEDNNAGPAVNKLAIVTNDPAPAVTAVCIEANVLPTGKVAQATVAQSEVNFGRVFRTSQLTVPVTVKNSGHDTFSITGVSTANGKVSIANADRLPVEVKPGAAFDIAVAVPTDTEGDVSDVVTVTTTAPEGTLTVAISGTVAGCPAADLSVEAIEAAVEHGQPMVQDVVLTNSGNEPLVYAFSAADDIALGVPRNETSQTAYAYDAAVDGTASYNWVDIMDNGKGVQNTYRYYNEHDYVEVELPFTFNFYGQDYNRMYVYNTGFVSFTKRRDDKLWPEPPGDFPAGSVFTNIIAPYWGLHSMDTRKSAGTYHYVDQDRAVVSFMEYGNSMNMGVCFQVILEKDGSFKFQYKALDQNAQLMGAFGLAGIANLDGDQYVRLPERYIAFGNAVAFKPVVTNTLAPGASANVTVTPDTKRMGGMYESAVTLTTNAPGRESVAIPVNLFINGTPCPEVPDSVVVEHVVGFQSMDQDDPLVAMGATYAARFSLANTGTANMLLANVSYPYLYEEDMDFGGVLPVGTLMARMPMIDWITGEPTGQYEWQPVTGTLPGQEEGGDDGMDDGMGVGGGFAPFLVGETPVEFGYAMLQSNTWMTPGVYDVPVTLTYFDDMAMENMVNKTVNLRFVVTPPPAMTLDKDIVYVQAETDDFTTEETFTIGNAGEYKLTYSLTLDASGNSNDSEGDGGGAVPSPMQLATVKAQTLNETSFGQRIAPMSTNDVLNAPNDFEFLRALYHDAMPGTQNVYGFGSFNDYDVFRASTAFVAPNDGFNVSHVYLPVSIGTAANKTVTVELLSGNDPATGKVLGRGRLLIEKQDNPTAGKFYVVPLDKPSYMNPGEEFCLVITYPEGIQAPGYVCGKEEGVVDGRYMGWMESTGWFDLGRTYENQYGSLGFVSTCLETKSGSPWVTLLTPATDAVVEPGQEAQVKVRVNASSARMEKGNTTFVTITSNDPAMPQVNIPVILDLNGAPVIEMPRAIAVNEGDTATVAVIVTDPDYEAVDVTVVDADSIATLQGVDLDEATGAMSVRVAFAPQYGTAGEHSFRLTAADTYGHVVEATVPYVVKHVNRAPVATVNGHTVKVLEGKVSDIMSFDKFFKDPEGDNLTYNLAVDPNENVEVFTTTGGAVFHGLRHGQVNAVLTATDPQGLSTDMAFTIVVEGLSGVESVSTGGQLVDVNTSAGSIDIVRKASGTVGVIVYNAAGQCLYTTASVSATQHVATAPGVYVVIATDGTATERTTVIVR